MKKEHLPWDKLGSDRRSPYVEKSRYKRLTNVDTLSLVAFASLIERGFVQGISVERLSQTLYEKEIQQQEDQ